MGTNYYHRTNICECCNRYDERHIGKSSAGLTFGFRGYKRGSWLDEDEVTIKSYQDWLEVLESNGKIFDKYGREMSLEEFKQLVENKKDGRNDPHKGEYAHYFDDQLDDEGHSFSFYEFS